MKKIYFIFISIFFVFYIVREIRKKKFSIKESFWWFIASIIMLILSIFPAILTFISNFLGIEYPPSVLFIFCLIFLIFINFRNSKKISEQNEKIIELEQNLAILKERRSKK